MQAKNGESHCENKETHPEAFLEYTGRSWLVNSSGKSALPRLAKEGVVELLTGSWGRKKLRDSKLPVLCKAHRTKSRDLCWDQSLRRFKLLHFWSREALGPWPGSILVSSGVE